jgi:phage terminase large subunit
MPGGEGWYTLHVSCASNPRVAQDFIEQIKATYGEESNAFRVRVLGEFALRDDDVLIPAELVDAAMQREVAQPDHEPLVYGLDVARFGNDRSVLCKRRGNAVLGFKAWQNLDLMALVGAVLNEAAQDGPIAEVLIDSIGVGGGVADRLREVQSSVPNLRTCSVRDVNVSEAAALNPGANRLRDDLWMSCRDWLRARACQLPKDDDLRQELVSPTYKFTSTGKAASRSQGQHEEARPAFTRYGRRLMPNFREHSVQHRRPFP